MKKNHSKSEFKKDFNVMLQILVVIRIVEQAKVHAVVQNDPNFNDLESVVICWNTSNRMHWQIFANIIYLLALFLMHIFQWNYVPIILV